ncbi:putative tbp-associated factor taf [Tripterygium wilfordii]|uniref:Transcription initiation factor TFIID subunit 8 n=1 Tax=Tripterygium wilfordii TaxID=458696 RepID=A0A7J7CNF5_TRIWF|nr:transcription initiation factor TFIID subunit 8-like [Tripterygium wilfordii]KAF5735604.1 putative tbp-associated factor taf [Tripterygium wilfordii]
MSDGGGESQRVHKQPLAKRKSSSGDEFAQALAKIAVAQICESGGFQAFQQSALETLSDVAIRYIYDIGKTAHSYANLAGRTEGNVFDVIRGFEDSCLLQGFAGASDINHSLASSGVVREIVQYVGDAEDLPFAYSIPLFPIIKERKPAPSFLQIQEEPPEAYIPDWLPALPDPQTYLQLPTENEGATDFYVEKVEPVGHPKKIERPLFNFQRQFASNGAEGPSSNDHPVNGARAKQVEENNPFLAEPLWPGEKKVSDVIPPAKLSNEAPVKYNVPESHHVDDHVSVLGTFAPAIEAMKTRLSDTEVVPEKLILNQRPAVQFKIKVGRKSVVTGLDMIQQNTNADDYAPWAGKENGNDEKKKRVEKFLKESMEISKGNDSVVN